MFFEKDFIRKSSILEHPAVSHGFSTRLGGVSTAEHLKTMNVGFFRGDSDETVCENMNILCDMAGVSRNIVCRPQFHTNNVKIVTADDAKPEKMKDDEQCDGFVTTEKGITLLVRVADCCPVLLLGERADGSPVIGAVHAGWRGAASGIAANAVEIMKTLGAENIRAAIGASIRPCCYEVGEDLRKTVAKLQGNDFANRHVTENSGKLYADIAGINKELLLSAGAIDVDVSPECTACHPEIFHSHRVTHGNRGTMGAVIGII